MRWSLRLGHIRGVPVEVHWLFFLLLGWVALTGWLDAAGPIQLPEVSALDRASAATLMRVGYTGLLGAGGAVSLLLLVYACVLVHEIGHTLHAQALGIPVRRIWLLPIGGLAQLARLPERPLDELRVAVAGPAANLGLALIFGALTVLGVMVGPQGLSPRALLQTAVTSIPPTLLGVLFYLALANAGIALFNVLPAFPMDGGRILRSFLALILPRPWATRLVTALGWLLGLAFVLGGLFMARTWGMATAFSFTLVGGFVLLGAGAEQALEHSRSKLRGIIVRAAVRQPTWVLSPTDQLTPSLATSAFTLGQPVLPVVVSERLVGLLTRQDLAAALERVADAPRLVAHVMRTQFAYVRADEDLWHAHLLLTGAELGALPVLEGETLYGMLTPADIHNARFGLLSALRGETPNFIFSGGNPTV